MSTLTRRQLLGTAVGLTAGGSLHGAPFSSATEPKDGKGPDRFRYCLNMSTIRGQELSLEEEIDVAANAGYDAIEPWLGKINQWMAAGGKLAELRARIDDHGLTIESAIGFASWIVDDEQKRKAGFEEAKRDMETIAHLGGKRIAAPPAGTREQVDLDRAAERYRELLLLGDEMGVVPQVEMWGGHPAIGTVEKAIYIALASGHPKACFLGDVYHTYKGGSSFDAFRMLGPHALQTFHINDYPAEPPRETIRDEHRVYPGDGVGPVVELLRIFIELGAYPVLSLELFNKAYWKEPAESVAKTGLEKVKACVDKAVGG